MGKFCHNGTKGNLAELRSIFWIVRGRQVVKFLLRGCSVCRRLEGPAFTSPESSSLSHFRVDGEGSFESIGINYCGPVYIKEGQDLKKAYILLITCTTTRMTHLELAPNQNHLYHAYKDSSLKTDTKVSNIQQCKDLQSNKNEEIYINKRDPLVISSGESTVMGRFVLKVNKVGKELFEKIYEMQRVHI